MKKSWQQFIIGLVAVVIFTCTLWLIVYTVGNSYMNQPLKGVDSDISVADALHALDTRGNGSFNGMQWYGSCEMLTEDGDRRTIDLTITFSNSGRLASITEFTIGGSTTFNDPWSTAQLTYLIYRYHDEIRLDTLIGPVWIGHADTFDADLG